MMTRALIGLLATMLAATGCQKRQEKVEGVSPAASSHNTTNDREEAVRTARFGFVRLWPDVLPPTDVSVAERKDHWLIVYPPQLWLDPEGAARPSTGSSGVLRRVEFRVGKSDGRVQIRPLMDQTANKPSEATP